MVALFTSLNATDAQAASYDKAYASKTLTVKASAGTSYKTLGKIKVGKLVKVYGGVEIRNDQYNLSSAEQYGWSKIKYNNKTAYVRTHELNFSDPFKWAPGVKDRVYKSIKKNDYAPKGTPSKFVKSYAIGGIGYYSFMVKDDGKWYQVVYINCKTGLYHG
ncbi:hypothetical protein JFL43_16050 [Viridibacillus sp. YIM B01967]|uniref:SH3b domain-containing protein n=1 Tax=Viridibacillus soli TaxID=2798301 RepID=A0ABS1HA92_9BACL|nr:SH3 domain-containing protein [Viridibacillus soli]MBK3496344.1 hypothetical protein [Viridibacillus soli]